MSGAGLYIHIPFCYKKCRYCNFYSEPIEEHNPERLISAIINEMRLYDSVVEIDTIYIGGGSPSSLPQEQLLRLVGEVKSCFTKPVEFTIEANPAQLSFTILSDLYNAGVNRLSIGAQSFNQQELAFLGRSHCVDDITEAFGLARQASFRNINLDLIFAIPGSTIESWRQSLLSAIELGPEHISVYSLTYERQTSLQRDFDAGLIKKVDEETDRQMYLTAIETLEQAGFEQYEISNFAKKGFQCRHNIRYWSNIAYIGLGPAGGSYWKGQRTLNIADINQYINRIENGDSLVVENERPGPIETACETAVLNLRTIKGIDLNEFKVHTGFDVDKIFAEGIKKNIQAGLIKKDNKRLYLTRKALPIADSVLCDFAAI